MSGTVGKPSFGRMTAIRIMALAVACVFAGAPAFAAKYFDPEKRRWIEYDADRVRGAARAPSVDPKFQRQVVEFRTAEQPGTIIIDCDAKFLYYVLPDQQAIRYGVGVGRDGFGWSGI